MQCDICHRASTARLPFNCTTCARNALYRPRIQYAQVLLEAEKLTEEVERNVAPTQPIGSLSRGTSGSPKVHVAYATERLTAERVVLEEKTEAILAQAETLRKQTEELKVYLDKKKAELSERRSNLEAATRRLSERPKRDLEPLEKDLKRTKSHWDALHSKTAEARAFLCREAAQLYGLQQRKRRKGTPGRDFYFVGGTPVCDLRDLNSLWSYSLFSALLTIYRCFPKPSIDIYY